MARTSPRLAMRRLAQEAARRPLLEEIDPSIELAQRDFAHFCTLMGKPPMEHMLLWHQELNTGVDSTSLIGVAGPNTVILSPRGPLAADTPVATPDGWRPLGEIKVGDYVYSDDGLPTEVINVVDYPDPVDVYKVTFCDGSTVLCDDSHRWDVRRVGTDEKGSYRTMTLQLIRCSVPARNGPGGMGRVHFVDPSSRPWLDSRGYSRYQVPVTAPVAYQEASLPLEPYLLGALLGDGSFRQNPPRITKPDADVLDRARKELPEGVTMQAIREEKGEHRFTGEGSGRSNPLTAAIRGLGLDGKGSHEKFIPRAYLHSSIEQRQALLQGLLDTDGTVNRNATGGVSFATSSIQLALDFIELVRSLGGYASMHAPQVGSYRNKAGERVICKTSYKIGIRLPEGVQPFYCQAKASRYGGPASSRSNAGLVRSIRDIEYVGKQPTRCITVQNSSERFLVEDYQVVKNSAKSTALILWVAWLIGRHAMAGIMLRVLYVSFTIDISRAKSAAVKGVIGTQLYRRIFPKVRVSDDKYSDALWSIDFKYAGIDVTGEDAFTICCSSLKGATVSRRSNIVILDDLIKDRDAISNPEIRAGMASNWSSAIMPTMLPGARAVSLGTRFLWDDIFATHFTEEKGWKVLVQKAIIIDPYTGDERSYWPEFYTLEDLRARRDVDAENFTFQYQNEIVKEGELGISRAWLQYAEVPDSYDLLGMSVDLSSADKERNDWTVFLLGGRDGDKYYFIDYRRIKTLGNMDKIEVMKEMLCDWGILRQDDQGRIVAGTATCKVWPESIAYQRSFAGDLLGEIRSEDNPLDNLSVTEVKGYTGDKMSRLKGVTGLWQRGKVYLNKYRDWSVFETEFLNFGGGAQFDDFVDASVILLSKLSPRGAVTTEYPPDPMEL